ncbi:zinc fingers and homeoboxes protein 3 [Eucyclogobius newberryi]|uniref:zinc fingers and homeoboxes protein 3 n=1 Tax=Eucyclogobius newberryi TaxID=166745 RepID=UPI003B58D206
MASKRKSSTPCMIPSKALRPADERDQDSPIYLGPSSSLEIDRNNVLDASEEAETAEENDGTYTCRPCNFETLDLNLFLDHVYCGHPDFRADSSFLCLTCGISSAKFEGLALHNARVHPTIFNTSLQLKMKDKRAVVEQTLLNRTETGKDVEIAITKTPIMRLLKGKSEAKKIVVSHSLADEAESLPGARETDRKDCTAALSVSDLVHNGTAKVMPSAIQIVNGSGALPVLKTSVTQVVSVVQNKNKNSTPAAASNVSSSSSQSSKNLPKVMIPLSSIPSYSASMDESSFLKTSFSKFPYPTKAELCYLTVVTKFLEEQIKIWFTAQRLKQGISWSPEEIEEARRKMFNTIIQTAPASSPSTAQHTITVLPASLGATGLPQILQGSLVSQGGMIVTQPMMANGIQVSSAPVALAVTPKPQAAARPMMQARPAAALVADKGISMVIGTVGSSSVETNVISSSKRNGATSVNNGQTSVLNLSLGSNRRAKNNIINGKHSHVESQNKSNCKVSSENKNVKSSSSSILQIDSTDRKSKDVHGTNIDNDVIHSSASNSPSIKMDNPASPSSKSSSPSPAASSSSMSGSKTPVNPFLDPSFYKGKKSQIQLGALKDSFLTNQFPDQEEVDRLIALTGLTVREVRKWFSDRRYHLRNLKGSHKRDKTSTSAPSTPGSGTANSGTPLDLTETSGTPDAKPTLNTASPQSPPVSQTPTSPITPSRRAPRQQSPDFTAIRYKEREPRQVKALEASFSQDPDPSNEEVDRLRSETKMTRREIHGWFTERRKREAAEKRREEEERAIREEEELEEDEETPKVNPIKINLKMLKVTESKQEAEACKSPVNLQNTPSSSPGPIQSSKHSSTAPKTIVSPKPAAYRGKKTPEQLHMLKQVYARTQWPSATQYDELISGTGLPRPEVVRWFGDCRYVQKNGQLKWLETYQHSVMSEDLQKGKELALQAHLDNYGRLNESELEELTEGSGLTGDLVKFWFSTKASSLLLPQSEATKPVVPGSTSSDAQQPGSASPMEPQRGAGNEEKMEQSVCGVSKIDK